MKHDQLKMVYGIHAVSRLLDKRPERVRRLLLSKQRDDAAMRLLLGAAEGAGLSAERVVADELVRLAGHGRHQGAIAWVEPVSTLDEPGLAALLDRSQCPLLLMLDSVQDPHNLGACLRTAEAAGAEVVIIPRNRAVGLTAAVRKVAAGSADFIPVARVTNLARTLGELQERGIWCYGAAAEASQDLYSLDLEGPVCLVLGGESRGLRRLTRAHCDLLYSIPMQGGTESLNVSVAAGISLFEAARQRRAGVATGL